jgi:predicted O-linked N-acetylglucosamine transferase (SPINDLY family)
MKSQYDNDVNIRMASVSNTFDEGFRHHQAGRLSEAEESYRAVLAQQPDHPQALHLLGVVQHQLGRHAEAVELIRQAIALDGDVAVFHSNLSTALGGLRRFEEAAAACRRALEIQPDFAEAYANLGIALIALGQPEHAVDAFHTALKLQPANVEVARNLGTALMKIPARVNEAILVLRRVLELKPNFAEAGNDLGCALKYAGQLEAAVAAFRRVLEIRPTHAGAYNNLSTALRSLGRLGESLAACKRAVELQPDLAEAHSNLGIVLTDIGELDPAFAAFQRALELRPSHAADHSRILFGMQYRPGVTPAELARAHVEYDQRHAAGFRSQWQPHRSSYDPQRKLRVGFLSGGLGLHPVGYFLVGLLENIDRSQFEVVCYSDRTRKDAMTARIQALAAEWHDVFHFRDEQLTARIRQDQIDILFDLDAHASGERLLVLARKPAPIQIAWAGYTGTTGLAAIDYLLADRWHVPEGADIHYREKVLRMSDGYICYYPPTYAPKVSTLPAERTGFVTFGSFNQPTKTNRQVVSLWAQVLKRVPQSRLLLKYRGFDDASIRDPLLRAFADEHVGADRIALQGKSPHLDLLAEYGRVDIGLDTFPYSGGLTTCEALWMGVPVVTLPGETFAGRHSLSHLSNVGLSETIAGSEDEYVERAAQLAADAPHLAALRSTLRQRMAASPLCDASRFARNWEQQMRSVWRKACGGR